MTTTTQKLAKFASELKYDDIPPEVIERTKDNFIDTIGACTFGSELPWSKMVIAHATTTSGPGKASIFGPEGHKVQPAMAALANGTLAHSFELDNLRMPSVGMHSGACLVPPSFAMGQQLGVSGKDLLTAFTSGIEVLNRVGQSSNHSCEDIGFHNPGINGSFGASMAAGRLMGLTPDQMTNALGISGSLVSGLLEFAMSGTGGMIKRLHMGRASESGILAATLARDGYEGPNTVLEGKFGWINVFCRGAIEEKLTEELGTRWDAPCMLFKRFSCHITSHTPVQGILDMKEKYGFTGDDIAKVLIEGDRKAVTHHDIKEPQDVMLAQYSNNFCLALAMYKDPMDPRNFSMESVNDPKIRALAKKVDIAELPADQKYEYTHGTRLTVTLKDGRELKHDSPSFKGMPTDPLDRESLWQKFSKLAYRLGEKESERLFEQLCDLDKVDDIGTIDLTGKA
jgi:2-methylcitrate dehydratase PrpD